MFLASVQTLTGILQGIGRQMIPVVNLAIGALVKLFLTYTLTAVPAVNIKGAAAGTVSAYLTASVLNMRAVRKSTGARFRFSVTFLRPAAAALIMGAASWLIYRSTAMAAGSLVATGTAILAGMLLYTLLIFLFGAVSEEELERIPGGSRLVRLLHRLKRKN